MSPAAHGLWRKLSIADAAVESARAAIITEINRQLDEHGLTVYAFAKAYGINRPNLYILLKGERWNANVARQALKALGYPTEGL